MRYGTGIIILTCGLFALILAGCGGSSSPGGSDEGPPSIVSWDPAPGSIVSPDLDEIVIRFSESVVDSTLSPQSIDIRLMMSMFRAGGGEETGEWNADSSILSIPLEGLPTGSMIFVDLGPFQDKDGESSEDPPVYELNVSGDLVWFPHEVGDWWLWMTPGEERDMEFTGYLEEAEEVSGAEFTLARKIPHEEDFLTVSAEYFGGNANVISLRGFGRLEGEDWIEMIFEPNALTYFSATQDDWMGAATVPIDFGEGEVSGAVSIGGEILGTEDLRSILSDEMRRENEAFDLIFPNCRILRLEHGITGEFDGDPNAVYHEGVDTLWFCPGVGRVKCRGNNLDWNPTEQDYNSSTIHADLLFYGPEGFELPGE